MVVVENANGDVTTVDWVAWKGVQEDVTFKLSFER